MSKVLAGAAPKTFTKTVPTGTAEQVMAAASDGTQRANGGVCIKALSTNTVAVYVGGSNVSTSSFPLLAGESITIGCDDPSDIWCISGSSSQVLRGLYL